MISARTVDSLARLWPGYITQAPRHFRHLVTCSGPVWQLWYGNGGTAGQYITAGWAGLLSRQRPRGGISGLGASRSGYYPSTSTEFMGPSQRLKSSYDSAQRLNPTV